MYFNISTRRTGVITPTTKIEQSKKHENVESLQSMSTNVPIYEDFHKILSQCTIIIKHLNNGDDLIFSKK